MLLRRRFIWVVLLALVTAQALGLMHRVVHAPQAGTTHLAHVAHDAEPGQSHGSWAEALFAGHGADADCRLFDPLAHDGPPAVPAVVLPLLLTAFFLDTFAGDFLVRWSALFDARGPPPLH